MVLEPFNEQPFYAYLLTLDALGRRDEALEELQYPPSDTAKPALAAVNFGMAESVS